MYFAALHVAELDGGLAPGACEAIGQTAHVGRQGRYLDAFVVAAIEHTRAVGLEVYHDQLVAVVGEGDLIAGRRDEQVDSAAKLDSGIDFWLAGIFGVENDQRFASNLVADGYQAFAIVEPFQQTVTHPVGRAVLEHRSLPVAERESFAARGDCQGMALRVQRGAVQVASREDKLAVALGARAWQEGFETTYLRRGGIEQVQVCACVVDHALPVAREVTGVEVLVVAMAAQVFAQGRAGINVAHPFMVGNEIDALAYPARCGDIAVQPQQALECSVALDIAPEVSGGAAPVAFPASRFVNVAPDDHAAVWPVGDGVGLPDGQLTRLSASRRDGINIFLPRQRLCRIAGVQDGIAVWRPANYLAGRALKGKALRNIAR